MYSPEVVYFTTALENLVVRWVKFFCPIVGITTTASSTGACAARRLLSSDNVNFWCLFQKFCILEATTLENAYLRQCLSPADALVLQSCRPSMIGHKVISVGNHQAV